MLAVIAALALALGCSGKSTSGDDDEDGGASGSSGSGGSSGSSSTTGCISFCQEAQTCPDVELVDCPSECQDLIAEATSYGCSREFDNLIRCGERLADLCTIAEGACTSEVEAYSSCLSGEPSAECNEETPARSATCLELCQRADACDVEATDCATVCAEEANAVATAGCTQQYQAYMNCAATCENFCALSENDCPVAFAAFVDCYLGP